MKGWVRCFCFEGMSIMFLFLTFSFSQVRMKLVKDWLPVLNVCRDIVSPMPSSGHKLLYQELEETFLRIISTLPMTDAQEFLQQCLSFSTRDVDDCPHLVGAFKTWFRRANRPPHDENATWENTEQFQVTKVIAGLNCMKMVRSGEHLCLLLYDLLIVVLKFIAVNISLLC